MVLALLLTACGGTTDTFDYKGDEIAAKKANVVSIKKNKDKGIIVHKIVPKQTKPIASFLESRPLETGFLDGT